MQPNGMIFWDWNGTLMDDVDFTHECLNWMLETHGYPQRYDLAAYRELFGFPIEDYYRCAGFDFARHPYPELAARFMEHYNAGVPGCAVTAHAVDTLQTLARMGWQQAVLSASRRDYLIEQVSARGLQGFFTELLGLADIYGVSKVQLGTDYLRRTGIDPAACVMVGDTDHDAAVAAAIGATCVLYTGGHQSSAPGWKRPVPTSSTTLPSCPHCWKRYNISGSETPVGVSEPLFYSLFSQKAKKDQYTNVYWSFLVGAAGFEPTASSSRTRRATNCAMPRKYRSLFGCGNWLGMRESNSHK